MNVAKLAEWSIEVFGDYQCLHYEDRSITNREFVCMANKFADALSALGIRQGERVAVISHNSPDVILSYSAIWRIGAIVVPIIPALATEEIRYILDNSGTESIITSPELLQKVRDSTSPPSNVRRIILTGSMDQLGTISMYALLRMGSPEFKVVECDEDHVCTIIYTAGTTGRPKGVMLTHKNLLSNAEGFIKHVGLSHEDRRLIVLPLSHAFGLGTCNTTFLSGARTYILRSFNVVDVLRSIEKYRITQMSVVPTMLILMLNHPESERFDTTSVRLWISGSAPLPLEVMNAFERKFGGQILEGYGCSEASAGISINPLTKRKAGSVGIPFDGVHVRIVDRGGRDLPAGEEGELIVKGPNVMKGYYRMPQETSEVLRKGWLHTGDICRIDEEGYIYVVDRLKDLIIRGGKNVYPREVEEALYRIPKIAEAAVIGVPDPVYGEEVKAFVVLKPGEKAHPQEIMEACTRYIAKFKVPKIIEIVESLPKSTVGKVLKKVLREQMG